MGGRFVNQRNKNGPPTPLPPSSLLTLLVRFWGFGDETVKGHPPSHPSSAQKGGRKTWKNSTKTNMGKAQGSSHIWKFSSTRGRGALTFHFKTDMHTWSNIFSRLTIKRDRTRPQIFHPRPLPPPPVLTIVVGANKHDDHWATSVAQWSSCFSTKANAIVLLNKSKCRSPSSCNPLSPA